MKTKKSIVALVLAVVVCSSVFAREDIGKPANPSPARVMSNGCPQDQGAAFLELNNVRVRIMDEGDMWWNPGTNSPQYFVPKGGTACSLFAGSLWIGGLDAGGQLKVSAMTYRQNGEDFWAGPLDTATVSITTTECQAYDKLYPMTRQEVQDFVDNKDPKYLTQDILNWPGNGNSAYNEAKYLAPFVDVNGDGIYEPTSGDYPAYDLTGKNTSCKNELFGDATLWWVFNDEGNIHSESGGLAIGLEIRAQAFEFQTNDAVNNMTFYNYQVINRSSYQINKTYFGSWVDPDLGNGADDFVGCDVGRGMGYCFNGEPTDPDGSGAFAGETGYHNYPPAIGVDFFQGPKADKNDTSCYVQNGLIGMAHFVYYNNDFSVIGNPQNASHYYNYLQGLWTDGTPMTYGGNGYQTSTTRTNYMFDWTPAGSDGNAAPTNTDPTGCGTNHIVQSSPWDEVDAGDAYGDRRFIQSAGPFTLAPGAVNYVTTGAVWDQSSTPKNNLLPIGLIQTDDDLAQSLFNNCFKVLDGPDAPDLTIQELNQELVITLTNATSSNNYKEKYRQTDPYDPYLNNPKQYPDTSYKFEGYQIFQVVDSTVTSTELQDPTKARLVAECDIKNGVTQLVNYTFNQSLNANVPTLMVTGADKGIIHSFDVKSDLFQIDNIPNLVNDRPYYYLAVAYAYNNFLTYNPNGPDSLLNGQKTPYLQGRRNIKVYKAVPHIPTAEAYGTTQNSSYGDGPEITRIEGHGNGPNVIDLNQTSIDYILQNDTMAHPTYVGGEGPIAVKVVDPLSVPHGNFIVKVYSPAGKPVTDSTFRWVAYKVGGTNSDDTIYSDTTIGMQNEQIIPQWGLSIQIFDVDAPGARGAVNNGALDSSCTMTFADPTKVWLTGVQAAAPGPNYLAWIRSGTFVDKTTSDAAYSSYTISGTSDPNEDYTQIINGTWAPYPLAGKSDPKLYCDNGPKFPGSDFSNLNKLASVDLVITSDRSKWTRCPVLEEQDESALAQGGASKLYLRASASVDQGGTYASGNTAEYNDPTLANYISAKGMGWFPGYAINVETGERLNMAFGEDSWLAQDNGRDMRWNPDSIISRPDGTGATGVSQLDGVTSVFGGKHYIYIFGHNGAGNSVVPAYDAGRVMDSMLATKSAINLAKVYGDAMWVGIPLLAPGHSLLETDVTIHLRVAKPYANDWGANWRNSAPSNNNLPMYSFGTDGIAVDTNQIAQAKSALNLINIVPNPYYAYSSYESDRLDTRVRITNLPPTCTITIFTLNGTLVKVINKENPLTYLDWNLQNQYNVPIASGMYIIHIAVPGVGEKTLKWFGVMRPLDLNSY